MSFEDWNKKPPEESEPRLFDIEIEQQLLGKMLVDDAAIARLQSVAEPDDFYDPMHRRICEFIFDAAEQGRAVDPMTVGAGMSHDPGLLEVAALGERTGEPRSYLTTLALVAPSRLDVESLGAILADLRSKRDAVDAMAYAKELFATDRPVSEALAGVVRVFDNAQARGHAVDNSAQIGDAANALLRQSEEMAATKTKLHASTGIQTVDKVIGGLYPENLIVVGGRPGMGKSILATHFCRIAYAEGWFPHLFSLEMSRREVAARMIADHDYDAAVAKGSRGLAYADLLHSKKMTIGEFERAALTAGSLREMDIDINDRGKLSIAQIGGLARARAARVGGKVLIVVDHLQIVAADKGNRFRTRVDEITEITGAAKQLAKRLACPVVLLSQLNRQVESREDKHPVMADFRESGSVEQDADVVIALHRPAYYAAQAFRHAKTKEAQDKAEAAAEKDKNLLELDVLKNRNGPTEICRAWVDVRSSVIRDRDPAEPDAADLLDHAYASPPQANT